MTLLKWKSNGWHVDHIKPLYFANNEVDAKRLCHYTDLKHI